MPVNGRLSTMSIADVIQWARTAHRTGILKVKDDVEKNPKELKVSFRDGRIVFSASNARREAFSRYIVFHGLCLQADVEEAIKTQEATGAMFASILVRNGKLTEKDAIATLTEKTTEDLCDIFLWKYGSFEFQPLGGGSVPSLPLGLDPIQIVAEGIRRVDVWNRITAYVHPRTFFEPTEADFSAVGPWEDERMAKFIRGYLDGQHNVDELLQILPFSRYKIFRAVSEMLDKKLIRPGEMTAIVDRERRTRNKLEEARGASKLGRWTEAMEILQGLVTANPGRTELRDELIKITDGFRDAIYAHNFVLKDVPVVTIGPDALSHVKLEPTDAFILSRIDGRMNVQQILKISPVNEFEGLRTFKRLLTAKVIDFPRR